MKNHKEQFPIIRFHTYRDEWKQHKLGEVFEQTVEYVDPYEQNLELWSVTVESGLTPKEERYNREFLVKKSDKFKKLYPEEIVYNPMNITIGAVGFNNAGKEVAVSGYYVTMKIKSKFSNKFFSEWLSCPKAIRLYKIYSTGSLIERQRVQFPTLSDIKDYFPTFEEQFAIGSLFCTLDDLLASYKDNLTNYQSLKATMLSKMFPKAGQTVPEIRLDGFEGDWELIKLGEVCDLITKGTTAKSQSEQGKVNFVKVENLKENEIYPVVKISEEEHLGSLKRSILYEGDILFSIAGTLGRTAIVRNNILPANTNQALAIIRGYKLYAYFLLVVLSGEVVKDYIRKNPTVGAQPNLSLEQVSSLKIQVPSIEEQQAIGSYFSNLNNLISSNQEKISQLETLKKKLLQDMFI
ncbi:restriction endonuclease subunit S [uncultured Streptococcus sp.]|uniref:restriction endonuclease subunit S n=1 Tax=uncultured Streptococcus sp. TaxID=83427 RepID=UPI0028D91208|nr:restriction endonuclease subunit S [uncultured Streptococcus sp.]